MRKGILVLFILALCGSILLADGWFSLQRGKSGAPAEAAVWLLADDSQLVSYQVDLDGVLVGVQPSHGSLFSTLDIPGAGQTSEVGGPRLPVLRRFVEVPAGARASASLEVLDARVFPLRATGAEFELFPVQLPVEKLAGVVKPFQKDARIYGADAYYPAARLTVGEPMIMRGRTLLMVEFAPVRYNPARGEVEVVRSARIDIRLDGGDLDKSDALAWEKYSPAFERWFEANVTNYRPFNLTKGTSTLKYAEGILYIIGSSYYGNTKLNNWIAQRQADGHKVVAVSTATAGTTDTAIRTYIQGQFASWTNPSLSYVVLVGDVADVATHNGAGGGNSQVTDLYYAAITPDPYTSDWSAPDLVVSRISCNSTAELEQYIDRAVKYTTANFTDTAWMKKLSFPASSDNSSITEGTHNYVINTYTAARGYTGTFPTNPAVGGDKCYVQTYSLTPAQEAAAFNNGRLVINDSGHGAETYWADPSFDSTNLAGVTHATAMPFVISNACITGRFARTGGDCWGEIWLAHTSGAILYWGASNLSYWTEDDILEKRMWDGIFASGITTLGDITQNAKMQTLAHFGANDTMYYYFEMYNMLGDATIDLYTDAYYNLTATYPAEILLGMNSVTFHVTDGKGVVANALVSLRGINVQQVGYTDASGDVTLVMDPMPNTVGTLDVAITAHNGKRHTGAISVIPASGPYLTYESHSLLLGGAEPVSTPHPGYTYVMPVTLRNVGVAEAQNITAVLSTTSPYITINDANSAYNNIPAGGTGQSVDHVGFVVAWNTPDATSIPFTLSWTTLNETIGTTTFNIVVRRPILVYQSHTVDDSAGGCDTDGMPDVNETVTFTITVRNDGSCDATNALAWFAAPLSGLPEYGVLGDIPSGGTASATFTGTVTDDGGSMGCPELDRELDLYVGSVEASTNTESSFTQTFNADIAGGQFSDNMESGVNGWTHSAAQGADDWAQVTTDSHSATHSWFATDAGSLKDDYLVTPAILIGATSTMTFWHKYGLESSYDGAVIEVTTDGGATWADLGTYITANGYTGTISTSYSSPIAGRQAWTGTLSSWTQVTVNLSAFGPNTIQIRFRIACDSSLYVTGWWVDDVLVDSQSIVCQQAPCDSGCTAGDLDKSGDCDSADCMLLCSYLTGCADVFACDISYADLDGSAAVNAIDLAVMLNHLAGNIPVIPLP